MENSISLEGLKTHFTNKSAHILYLLRLGIGEDGAFKSMAEMAKDMGVTDGYIRQVKYRKIHIQPCEMYRAGYAERILQLWGVGIDSKRMPLQETT